MKKKSLKKAFNKKINSTLLLGITACFSPLLVMASCTTTTIEQEKSQNGNENKNPEEKQLDALGKKIQKLTYTALSNNDLKNVTISNAILDESVSEKLGFVLPDSLREYIEKDGEEAAQYIVKVSKAKGSFEVNYKHQKTGDEKEMTQKVTMIPYQDNDLSTILDKLKNYNATFDGEDEWKNLSAENFSVPVNSHKQLSDFQVKKLAEYANTLHDNLRIYIRKEKNKDASRYFVTKKLEQGQKIIAGGEPVKVSPTVEPILSIVNKLKNQFIYNGAITTVTSAKLKNIEHGRTTIVPKDPNNKFDWGVIKISESDNNLPKAEELQDSAATTKGKLEVEKLKGEDTIHWYITYIDANNNPLTEEYITKITTAAPTLAEAEKYDWEHAAILKHGDSPMDTIIATKPVISRIKFKGGQSKDKDFRYIYTNAIIDGYMVEYRKYAGVALDSGAWDTYWVASNAKLKYFNDIRVLESAIGTPTYEEFNEENGGYVAEEVRYMEVQ